MSAKRYFILALLFLNLGSLQIQGAILTPTELLRTTKDLSLKTWKGDPKLLAAFVAAAPLLDKLLRTIASSAASSISEDATSKPSLIPQEFLTTTTSRFIFYNTGKALSLPLEIISAWLHFLAQTTDLAFNFIPIIGSRPKAQWSNWLFGKDNQPLPTRDVATDIPYISTDEICFPVINKELEQSAIQQRSIPTKSISLILRPVTFALKLTYYPCAFFESYYRHTANTIVFCLKNPTMIAAMIILLKTIFSHTKKNLDELNRLTAPEITAPVVPNPAPQTIIEVIEPEVIEAEEVLADLPQVTTKELTAHFSTLMPETRARVRPHRRKAGIKLTTDIGRIWKGRKARKEFAQKKAAAAALQASIPSKLQNLTGYSLRYHTSPPASANGGPSLSSAVTTGLKMGAGIAPSPEEKPVYVELSQEKPDGSKTTSQHTVTPNATSTRWKPPILGVIKKLGYRGLNHAAEDVGTAAQTVVNELRPAAQATLAYTRETVVPAAREILRTALKGFVADIKKGRAKNLEMAQIAAMKPEEKAAYAAEQEKQQEASIIAVRARMVQELPDDHFVPLYVAESDAPCSQCLTVEPSKSNPNLFRLYYKRGQTDALVSFLNSTIRMGKDIKWEVLIPEISLAQLRTFAGEKTDLIIQQVQKLQAYQRLGKVLASVKQDDRAVGDICEINGKPKRIREIREGAACLEELTGIEAAAAQDKIRLTADQALAKRGRWFSWLKTK